MNTDSKTTLLLTKLIRETSSGKVRWEVRDAPKSLNQATEQVVPLYLQTEYKGKILGLYEVRSKYFHDEDVFSWSEGIGFCIVDDQQRVIWESTQYSPALKDLFDTAREQASGINGILDDLLDG